MGYLQVGSFASGTANLVPIRKQNTVNILILSIHVKCKFINYHIYKVTATEPKVEEKLTSTQFIQRTASCVTTWPLKFQENFFRYTKTTAKRNNSK